MRISVNLDQQELNELIYALGMHFQNRLANHEVAGPLEDKLRDALDNLNDMIDAEDMGPEYDGAGFTEDDRIVDGQYRVINQ